MGAAQQAPPRILVCQRGARHRYAIPRLLEESGMLAALYTDSSILSPAGRLAGGLVRAGMAHPRARALTSRVPEGIPPEKVFSSDRLLGMALLGREGRADLADTYRRWGAQDAEVVYSMHGEEPAFLEWVKARGIRIAIDVFVHPYTRRIIETETAAIMGSGAPDLQAAEAEEAHCRQVFGLADALFCPSQWVAEGVGELMPEHSNRIRVVPYGSSIETASAPNPAPTPGRVLFAGRDPLRKGLHYLAEATFRLRGAGLPVEVLVAGVSAEEVAWMPHRDELRFLGTIPMQRMREEFMQADMLVLPSLSEGQAGVILEAMACGCPVIATRESGVDFDPDCGIAIPVRDADALAAAISGVAGDRGLRERLARGALRQSRQFSAAAWRERLISALCEVAEMSLCA